MVTDKLSSQVKGSTSVLEGEEKRIPPCNILHRLSKQYLQPPAFELSPLSK